MPVSDGFSPLSLHNIGPRPIDPTVGPAESGGADADTPAHDHAAALASRPLIAASGALAGMAQRLRIESLAAAAAPSPTVRARGAGQSSKVSSMTERLENAEGSGPGFLSFADSARDVARLARRLGKDGRLSGDEVERLVTSAKDFQKITDSERAVLVGALEGKYGEVDDVARQALARFLHVADPGTSRAAGKLPPLLDKHRAFHQVLSGSRVLGTGDYGASIKDFQRHLSRIGYPVAADGKFGPGTARVLKRYQADHGLSATGKLDRQTLARLSGAKVTSAVTGAKPKLSGNMAKVLRYKDAILAASRKYGVPAEMIAAIIDNESGGKPDALSFDAQHGKGLMQIDDRFHKFARTKAVFDPAKNIDYGARILRDNLRAFKGNRRAAIAAFNAGIGGVRRKMRQGKDPSTATYHKNYLQKADRLMPAYRKLLYS